MARRPVQPMPADVGEVLREHGLRDAYDERPFYQRNDYLGWIAAAKRHDTRMSRIAQMLDELERGGVYMGMPHRPSARPRESS